MIGLAVGGRATLGVVVMPAIGEAIAGGSARLGLRRGRGRARGVPSR